MFDKIKTFLNNYKNMFYKMLIVLTIISIITSIILTQNIELNTIKLKEVHYTILFNIIKSIVLIIPAIYSLLILKDKFDEFKSSDDLKEEIYKRDKIKQILNIIQGIVFIFVAIKVYYFYKPNYIQRSMAILLKHLREKELIDPNVYAQLKELKPHNIKKYM